MTSPSSTSSQDLVAPDPDRPEVAPVRAGEELDWSALEAHLRAELSDRLELGPGFSVEQFPHGSANLTYRVALGDTRLVVRRPPFGHIAAGAHDMLREYTVLSRLGTAYPRAPLGLLHCADESVVGAQFLVSEYRPGIVVWDQVPASMAHVPDAGRHLGMATIEALADLHAVDYEACGLAGLGRPEAYLERQLRGWARRWADVATEGAESVTRAGERLAATMPTTRVDGVLHNDFKVDNCQFRPDDPTTVVSVFDWDMATLGDPLCDLGTLLNYWPQGDEPNAVPGLEALGLPSRDEVVERYLSRRDIDATEREIDWYEAFGCWKTAIILQQLFVRHVRGESSDPRMAERGASVVPLAERTFDLVP